MLFILCMPNAFREILHSVEKSICLSLLYFFNQASFEEEIVPITYTPTPFDHFVFAYDAQTTQTIKNINCTNLYQSNHS